LPPGKLTGSLRNRRLEHARQALEADAISPKELSRRVGYNHVSSFVHASAPVLARCRGNMSGAGD
jgi:AraC-like DNA-binding protein